MNRSLHRVSIGLTAIAACLLAFEFIWFVRILGSPDPPLRGDMLAVYGGYPERYRAGWRLESEGKFNYLVFSDASSEMVANMETCLGPAHFATVLLEPNARTTAQNARYVARLAEYRDCRSVLVVSSWWHLPRAIFLTRLAFLGRGVSVEGVAADPRPQWACLNAQVWLEGIRFWGSLLTFGSDARGSSGEGRSWAYLPCKPIR
jgi:hypothetical protein